MIACIMYDVMSH